MKNSRVNFGDVLLNITGASIGRSAVFKDNFSANVNQHVCIIRPTLSQLDSDFLNQYLTSSNGQQTIYESQAGGGREGLNFQSISEFKIPLPNISEQQQIACFFKSIDDSITLHQRKYVLLIR